MARISVKYPIGSEVFHKGGVGGIVTAIFIRGRGRAYEMSYVNKDGNPTSVTVEEIEIGSHKSSPIGFRSKPKNEMVQGL